MNKSGSLQKAIEYVEALSPEDQDLLLELIQKRRRRREIANSAAETLAAMQADRDRPPDREAAFHNL